jgi:hypothetical protein
MIPALPGDTLARVRRSAASRLHDLADRLEPSQWRSSIVARAPLVRIGGAWWRQDEITSGQPPAARSSARMTANHFDG